MYCARIKCQRYYACLYRQMVVRNDYAQNNYILYTDRPYPISKHLIRTECLANILISYMRMRIVYQSVCTIFRKRTHNLWFCTCCRNVSRAQRPKHPWTCDPVLGWDARWCVVTKLYRFSKSLKFSNSPYSLVRNIFNSAQFYRTICTLFPIVAKYIYNLCNKNDKFAQNMTVLWLFLYVSIW